MASKRVVIFLPEDICSELKAESVRLDRKVVWVLLQAWELARETIQAMPGPDEVGRQHREDTK